MALTAVRTDIHPPCQSATFTSFGSVLTLHTTSAPDSSQHLPTSIFVVIPAAGVFAWKDANGVANSLTFATGFVGTFPFTASTIETSTTATAVTVSWNPSP